MRLKRRTVLAAAGGLPVALSGCLGDEPADATPTDADDGTATGGSDEEVTVGVRSHPDHGDILVGPDELTLYNFDADTQGEPGSACYDDCRDSWPPLAVAGEPSAGDGVTADLTTFERDDGEMQVAANGWPLYHFVGDDEPGDADGQGANDVWWVLGPDGDPKRPEDDDGTGY